MRVGQRQRQSERAKEKRNDFERKQEEKNKRIIIDEIDVCVESK